MSLWFYGRKRLGRRRIYSVNVSLMACILFMVGVAMGLRSFVLASIGEKVGAIAVLTIVLSLIWRGRSRRESTAKDSSNRNA